MRVRWIFSLVSLALIPAFGFKLQSHDFQTLGWHHASSTMIIYLCYVRIHCPNRLPLYWHQIQFLPSVKPKDCYVDGKNITRAPIDAMVSRERVTFQLRVNDNTNYPFSESNSPEQKNQWVLSTGCIASNTM